MDNDRRDGGAGLVADGADAVDVGAVDVGALPRGPPDGPEEGAGDGAAEGADGQDGAIAGGEDSSYALAQAWMQSISVSGAGPEPAAIHVPSEIQDGLLQYYTDAVLVVGRNGRSRGGANERRGGEAAGGEADAGHDAGGDDDDQLADNDVPLRMADQATEPGADDELVHPGRVRRPTAGILLQELMVNQLMSSLGIASLAMVGVNSLYATRVAPIQGGGALAVLQGFKAYIVWAAVRGNNVSFLCSCGEERRATCVETHVKKGTSSSCTHADALRGAFTAVASQVASTSLASLVARYPALLFTGGNADDRPTVEHVATLRNDREVWAVRAMGVWCALVQPVKSAASQAPRCQNVLCSSRARCVHFLAFFKHKRRRARKADKDELKYDEDGVLLDGSDDDAADAAAVPEDELEEAEVIMRRSRNMLPCRGEVRSCKIFDSYGRAGRDSASGIGALTGVLHERSCVKCQRPRNNRTLTPSAAVLHTMGGRVAVNTGVWTCECTAEVKYDGADSALFAFSSKTLFTRIYLDIVLHIALTSRSSFTAATAAMAFCLHVTAGLPLASPSHTRQMIVRASGVYTETLIIPPSSYSCSRCESDAGSRLYLTLIADGQVLGFFRDKAKPFVRHLVDNPVVDVLISNGCAVKTASVRSAIRKRCSTPVHQPSSLTMAEMKAMMTFVIAASVGPGGERECDDAEIGLSSSAEAAWAASYVFSSFFLTQARKEAAADTSSEATMDSSDDMMSDDTMSADTGSGAADSDKATVAAEVGDGADIDDGEKEGRDWSGSDAVCVRIKSAVGNEEGDKLVLADQWRVVQRFMSTFLAEPVIGIFAGCNKPGIQALAKALVEGKKQSQWEKLIGPVERLSVVWPFFFLVGDDLDGDPDLARAIGELLLFAIDSDSRMEKLWWQKASEKQKAFARKWATTDRLQYMAWEQEKGITPPLPRVRAHPLSALRAVVQEEERRSGSIFPSLEAVRPFTFDSLAARQRKKKATQKRRKNRTQATKLARGGKAGKKGGIKKPDVSRRAGPRRRTKGEAMGTNDDDCRHAFDESNVFTPGMVNFVCPHGILVGFEMLSSAESPACIAEILSRRLPILPQVIYFDTACQASRNTTRRMPWLLRLSLVMWFLDRFHQPKHVCSDMFNPDEFPDISSLHKTSVAESRHALNKPLRNQVSYMTQDRFIAHMRLYGALNNLRMQYKQHLQPDATKAKPQVGNLPLPYYFHGHVVTHCERRGCPCRLGQTAADQALKPEELAQTAEEGEAVQQNQDEPGVPLAGEEGRPQGTAADVAPAAQ